MTARVKPKPAPKAYRAWACPGGKLAMPRKLYANWQPVTVIPDGATPPGAGRGGGDGMIAVPMSFREAVAFVATHHRHNRPPQGHKLSLGCMHDGKLVGVAIIGRPVARALDDGTTLEVIRCCVLPDAPKGTCSWLYSRARQIAGPWGYRRVITYTLESEAGASLRGAGWSPTKATKPHGWSHKESGGRDSQPIYEQQKIRWETTTTKATP